jgi:YVTN family beta-propeller protein
MMNKNFLLFAFYTFLVSILCAQNPVLTEMQRVNLPNGWSLTPAGNHLPLGDLPLNIAVSPSKQFIAVTNNGQSVQSLQLINVKQQRVVDNVVVPKLWYGLKFSADNKYLYASGGNDNRILKYAVKQNKLIFADSILLSTSKKDTISPAGIEIDEKARILYVVTKQNGYLYVIHLDNKKVLTKIKLPDAAYSCVLSADKKSLYISCWGCDKVLIYNCLQEKITNQIKVGDNPNELLISRKYKRLFVSNANDNSVSVIDLTQNKVIETLNAALYPNAPSGSTSNGLALSKDEKTLYIANADNNCLAVFDVSKAGRSQSKGFIPTGWYPTNVKVIGNNIYVSNGKGLSSKANPYGPNPTNKREKVRYQKGDSTKIQEVEYIGGLFKGTMSIIPTPNDKVLSQYAKMVYENTPYTKEKESKVSGEEGNPIPFEKGQKSPIKYVFYVVKENRTYDQVLSDIKGGNGDTSLLLFGQKCTPNQHALAKEFILLDNFYVDGEVSADGHNWSMGAYATDYLEKTWPTSYGGRGGNYDSEGGREVANNKNGFIWDLCKRNNVSFRTYGEFADNYKPNIPVLKGHFCPYYTSWDESVLDTVRFYQWKRDFDSLLKVNAVPQLTTLRFINDHTEGLRLDRPTPYAHVADNDLATGLFVEYLSHSKIWNECAIFILEDDAQNGPDHVDAHRSTAYVAGGKVKTAFIDHTMYSTSSMLRTIELILNLPPMTQYDAAAEPMWRCFADTASHKPFASRPNQINLKEVNTAMNEWQRRSEKFDFSAEDRVPDMELNAVLWYGLKGEGSPLPMPVRAAFLKTEKEEEED